MGIPVEIERKFIIAMPDTEGLRSRPEYTRSEIEQTYLESTPHVTHRVRKRVYADRTVYTETKKVRIDKASSFEDEIGIDEQTYLELMKHKRAGTETLNKVRHTFRHGARVVEIDVYPEWKKSAVLEVELDSRDEEIILPEFITVIAEVTGDKRYSNAAMSREFPPELI